jgi:DNA-binding MarR family transcriptional regulator
MVTRRRAGADRRQVMVRLRPAGEAVLRRLALTSLDELRTEGPALIAVLARLVGSGTNGSTLQWNSQRGG